MPPLRSRGKDIHLLFRKFSSDFAEKYKTPPVKLTDDAVLALQNYNWPGNIRQLKNFVTQLSVTEKERLINKEVLVGRFDTRRGTSDIRDGRRWGDSHDVGVTHAVLGDLLADGSPV